MNAPDAGDSPSWFVAPDSIVRRIWGDADVILLVFAGSAAEFALNRAVDWLFYTGAIPNDPVGRFFVTAGYARDIVFATSDDAARAIAHIRGVHVDVEDRRGEHIPPWAYRDVLYMLVDYSERGYELVHRELDDGEREELWEVFRRVGEALGVQQLPVNYEAWREDRGRHLQHDLVSGPYTAELQESYRRELGTLRYWLLRNVQSVLVPEVVRSWLGLAPSIWAWAGLRMYGKSRRHIRKLAHSMLIPEQYRERVASLDSLDGALSTRPTTP